MMDTMPSSVVKVNGVDVASDASRPTVINININQPSALSYLLDWAKTAWKQKSSPQTVVRGESPSTVVGGAQKVLGTIQIMIGLLCVSFAVIFCFARETYMFRTGSGFWTGFPFILTGAVAILGQRRSGCLWRCAAFMLHLVSLGVAIGAIVVISHDVGPTYVNWQWRSNRLCRPEKTGYYYGSYYQTTTPPPYNPRVEECVNMFHRLMVVFNGMNIVILVSTCLALCVSLYSLGWALKILCCRCVSGLLKEEENVNAGKDTEPLLTTEPPPYADKWQKVETI